MTLNVSSTENTGDAAGRSTRVGVPDRASLVADLLDAMTAWNPQDQARAFRHWHRGSLSLIHLNVISVIEAEGALPMRRLAEELDVSDASATGIVDRMERRGFVERRHDTDDRRVVLVHVTDAGRALFTDMEAQRRAGLTRVLGELSDEELHGLLIGIRAVHAARSRFRDERDRQREEERASTCAAPATRDEDR